MSSPRIVVTLSDLHAGSTVGLLPPDFETLEGQTIGLSPIQEWLWACWQDVTARLKEYVGSDPWALVINGDTIEGNHHRTTQIISPDVTDHQNAAEKLLVPFAKDAAKVYVTLGTECHTGSSEQKLAKKLNAVPDPVTKKYARDRLDLTVCDVPCVWFHHISPTTREYLKGSGLSITLGNEQLAAAKKGRRVPRIIHAAHRHDYDSFQDATSMIAVTPAWQCLTRHGYKVVPQARTTVGLTVMDWRGKKNGDLPLLHPILCTAPEPAEESL